MRIAAALIATLLVAGCARVVPEGRPNVGTPPPLPAPTATPTPIPPPPPRVSAGPSIASLKIAAEDARGALASFVESCPKLVGRTDASGLTSGSDWRAVCDVARAWPTGDAVRFFETQFDAARLGDGKTFITGYFEPEIAGCRTPNRAARCRSTSSRPISCAAGPMKRRRTSAPASPRSGAST